MEYYQKYNNSKQHNLLNYYLCLNPKKELFTNDRIKFADKANNCVQVGGVIQQINNNLIVYTYRNTTKYLWIDESIIFKKRKEPTKREKMLYLLQGISNNSIRIKKIS